MVVRLVNCVGVNRLHLSSVVVWLCVRLLVLVGSAGRSSDRLVDLSADLAGLTAHAHESRHADQSTNKKMQRKKREAETRVEEMCLQWWGSLFD